MTHASKQSEASAIAPESCSSASEANDSKRMKQLRQTIYWLLIAIAVGNMAGRILAVNSVDLVRLEKYRINQRLNQTKVKLQKQGFSGDELEARLKSRREELETKLSLQRPFLSSNDRSRWATVRSLVELGTYEIDAIIAEPQWDTIDMVQHTGDDGEKHLYSSKPPLLATLMAGEYWLVKQFAGDKTLGTHPFILGRLMLLLTNIPLAVLLFVCIAKIAERWGQTDFGRLFVMATATMGTLLSSFAVVLNNHLFGAASVAVALYAALRILDGQETKRWLYVLTGLTGAFAVTCELPALSLLGLFTLALFYHSPKATLLWFTPAVLLVAAAFFSTNYIAHGTFSPPYAHRHSQDPENSWYCYTYIKNGVERKSYWYNPKGIDQGEACQGVYAMNVLAGHHGIFSLTPVWLLSVFGAGMWLTKKRNRLPDDAANSSTNRWKFWFAASTLLLTLVCLVFFILLRPQHDRNYGGMTNGFRWMFWLIPLWLTVLLPVADAAENRRGLRWIAYISLACSVLSAAYATWNPWSQPWIVHLYELFGWPIV